MIFILGFISGVLVSLLILVTETYLDVRKKKVVEVIKEMIVEKAKQRGSIIPPETDKEVAQSNLIKYNEERGEGTPMKDLE